MTTDDRALAQRILALCDAADARPFTPPLEGSPVGPGAVTTTELRALVAAHRPVQTPRRAGKRRVMEAAVAAALAGGEHVHLLKPSGAECVNGPDDCTARKRQLQRTRVGPPAYRVTGDGRLAELPGRPSEAPRTGDGEQGADCCNANIVGTHQMQTPPLIPVGEPLPEVDHKGPRDTDRALFAQMRDRLLGGYGADVGGYQVRRALARLIEREIDRHDRSEGQ